MFIIESCKKCGCCCEIVTVVDNSNEEYSFKGFYKEFGYIPWNCPVCNENNLYEGKSEFMKGYK